MLAERGAAALGTGEPPRPACRSASQRGDSGTQHRTNNPSSVEDAPTSSTQRQSSMVILTSIPSTAMVMIPTLAAVPISPASIGRETSDQASEASDTPAGHMPP